MSERIQNLEQEVARHKEDSGKAQAEVDRLLEILREMENEKNDKDKKINELERWVYPRTASRVNGSLSVHCDDGLLDLFFNLKGFNDPCGV